ncbi:MAG: hypothetical protein OXU48_04120 [candidate division Zixibacteria bacterium]|nr:hypothetical protein [candidate division Zixibacteria bacterium]
MSLHTLYTLYTLDALHTLGSLYALVAPWTQQPLIAFACHYDNCKCECHYR